MLTASTEYSLRAKITPLADGAIIWGGNTMTTYIALFSLTDAGIKAAKDSPVGSTPPSSSWQIWAAR
jgi:hypothetical protein